jgi:hypothetical protein
MQFLRDRRLLHLPRTNTATGGHMSTRTITAAVVVAAVVAMALSSGA